MDALKEPNVRTHDEKIKSKAWNNVIEKYNAKT
jgi:hypothetical protein